MNRKLSVLIASVAVFGLAALSWEPGGPPAGDVDVITVTASTLGAALAQQTEEIPHPPAGKVAIRLNFRYYPEPLPGEGVTVWWPKPEAAGLWNECHCEKGVPLPREEPVEGRTVFLTPGDREGVLVMLVVENPTPEKLEWQALIPRTDFEASTISETRAQVWPTCFCVAGVHWAPPEGSWFRVIRLRAGPKLAPGTKVDLTWTVVTDPNWFVRPGG